MKDKNRGTALTLVGLFVFFGLIPVPLLGATIVADSCAYQDVLNATDTASEGDTVLVLSGECTWTSTLYINKRIVLSGSGKTSTVITNNSAGPLIEADGPLGQDLVVTGFHLKGAGTLIHIRGGQQQFQVYNNTIQQSSGYGIFVDDYTLGLIDHNDFIYTASESGAGSPITIYADGAVNAYSRDSIQVTGKAIYIEDNLFDRYAWAPATHAAWIQDGASMVVRNNTFINFDVDVHGNCSWYGAREYEIYDNSFTCESGVNCPNVLVLRGGTGVVYGNTFTNNGEGVFRFLFYDQRLSQGNCSETLYPSGGCIGSGVYADCSNPLEYQLGRGRANTLDPIYFWDNSANGVTLTFQMVSIEDGTACDAVCEPDLTMADTFQINRDIFFSTRPGYVPYTYPHPLTADHAYDSTIPKAPENLMSVPEPPLTE